MLASSCLGVLGPANLTTLILQPEPEVSKLKSINSPEYSFIKHLIIVLLDYLSDNDILITEACNITLFKIIATDDGQSIYGNIIFILYILLYFINCKLCI